MKYRNEPTVIGNEKYRSKREARRHQTLLMLQKAGHISQLQREVPFVLAPKTHILGEKRARPALRYFCDFLYVDRDGDRIAEDAKGMSTPVWRVKKHLMKTVHGIDVVEV